MSTRVSLLIIGLIMLGMVTFYATGESPEVALVEAIVIEEETEEEITYVCNTLGLDYENIDNFMVGEDDEVSRLMDKFEVKYEYRDLIRQLCEIHNVPVSFAISIAQVETHNGHIRDYAVRADYRMYLTWSKELNKYVETWDLGYFQMNDSLSSYWEECFFNPELLFSLGYVREYFDLTDDVISIQLGIAYLDYLVKYYHGDQNKATMAFNTGMGNVNRGNIPEMTYAYAHAVKNNWKYREKDV